MNGHIDQTFPNETLGVILAGGAGVRVDGADKGLLTLSGRPLVEHVLDRLRPQCERILIVANRNLDAYAHYAPAIHDEGEGHAGPLAGLVAVFGFLVANRHALPRWVLTVPVDCPDPPRGLATRLSAALTKNAAASCAFAAHADEPQPLLALYRIDGDPESWQVSAQGALREHGSPLRWHTGIGAVAVDFGDADAAFHNLNTHADFREYEQMHGRT